MQANNSLEPFVIIFQGRCGSTYLVEALDNHPEIECADERLSSLKNQNYGADVQLEWAEDFLSRRQDSRTTQKGFKTKLRDVLDPAGFSKLLQSLDCRIIHLRRKNVVKLTVSSFNSVRINDKTGDWNLYNRTNPLSETSIDLETFDSWMGRIEKRARKELAFVENLGLPVLTLFYEDFLTDSSAYFKRIFSFLGVPYVDVAGNAVKSTSDDLRLAVSNFDELRSHYKGTPYAKMFDEVIVG